MLAYALRRLLLAVPVLVAATFLVFVLVSLSSDPLGQLRQNPHLTGTELAAVAHAKGLDRPVVERYWTWAKDAVLHRFGTGLASPDPIWPQLTRALEHTLELLAATLAVSLLLGVAIGIHSALRPESLFDRAATALGLVGFALPVFWVALLLQALVTDVHGAWGVRIVYTSGLSSADPGHGLRFLLDRAQHLALPVVTLSVAGVAGYSRYLRASMLDVLGSDHVRAARAKGLRARQVIRRHVVRNALVPLATQVALDFGLLLGGAVVTETIFSLDGMGRFYVTALAAGDPYPVTAWLVVVAATVIFANLVADVLHGVLDPRIRAG